MKFSYSKAKITKDWSRYLDGFEIWKPKHLLRCHGPLIMGVCLDSLRDPNAYKPVFHFHNLAYPSDVITLSLSGPLLSRGVYQPVKIQTHSEKLPGIVSQLKKQYPLIESVGLSFNDYLRTISNYLSGKHGTVAAFRPNIYRDIVLLALYCGATDYANDSIIFLYNDLRNRTDYNMRLIGTPEKWKDEMQTINQSNVIATVESQKETHKLKGLHDFGLVFESPIEVEIVTKLNPS